MIFDEYLGQYKLTPRAIEKKLGINLREETKDEANADVQIDEALCIVSNHCYNYIHEFSRYNTWQDNVIKTHEDARNMIFRAMLEQFKHVKRFGDLSSHPDEAKRRVWFSNSAASILNKTLPSIGRSILYCGV